ncbi:MAG: hypothetical protein JWL59_1584 [Chthoniobacteraceae bacterium]|nr:hypothetical protein [Chthoniobacteraceae bacterium]
MRAPDFEQRVTRGLAHWVISVNHDPVTQKLAVELTHAPGGSKTQRVLEFADVSLLKNTWIAREEDCQEGLIGAHEEVISSGIRYAFVTDQREITFEIRTQLRIYEM